MVPERKRKMIRIYLMGTILRYFRERSVSRRRSAVKNRLLTADCRPKQPLIFAIMQKLLPLFGLLIISMIVSCDDDDSVGAPKPRGYFRINLPEKKYVQYDAECPYTFEIPDYAKMYHSAAPNADPCWRDLYFGQF